MHGGNLISLERAREASSRAVSAHLSGGGGCSLGSGLAKHHCRLGRTQLSRRRRLGQCVGCSSWSRSSCVHHSALYRSCVPDRFEMYMSSCLCIVARPIGKIVTMRHKIFKHFWHAAPRPSRTLLGVGIMSCQNGHPKGCAGHHAPSPHGGYWHHAQCRCIQRHNDLS